MTPSTGGNPISLCLSDDDEDGDGDDDDDDDDDGDDDAEDNGDDDDVMVTSNDKASLQLAEIQHPLVLSLSG